MFIDLFIVSLVNLLISMVFHFFDVNIATMRYGQGLVATVLAIIYFTVLDSELQSGSYGKQLLAIRVVDAYGDRPKVLAAFIRALIKMITGILPFLWLSAIFTEDKQAFHDIAARTYVVKA